MSIDSKEELRPLKFIISSFSEFVLQSKRDIYTGEEKIPFTQHNEKYQKILLYEFKDTIRQFLSELKS
jgi:hypothetical protein